MIGEEAIQEVVEDMFTEGEVSKRSYEKAEKFRRDQAALLKYAEEEGRKEGEKIGKEKGIKAMIAVMKELGVDKVTTIDKIMMHFALELNAAKWYVETNW